MTEEAKHEDHTRTTSEEEDAMWCYSYSGSGSSSDEQFDNTDPDWVPFESPPKWETGLELSRKRKQTSVGLGPVKKSPYNPNKPIKQEVIDLEEEEESYNNKTLSPEQMQKIISKLR